MSNQSNNNVIPSEARDLQRPNEDTSNSWVSINPEPTHHRSSRRKRRRRRRIIIALVCILAFAGITAGSAFAFTNLIEQGRLNLRTMPDAEIETEQGAVTTDQGKIVTYKGQKYRLNEDMITLCLIGDDKANHTPDENFNGQADFVMALAIDSGTGKMTGIVVPRDSMVDVDVNYIGTDELYKNEKLQLCLQYAYGTNDDESSMLVARAVSRAMYNIPIDYYYTIDINGVYELTDVVDGVVVEPLESIPGTDIVQGQEIKLYGQNAARYVQWRNTNELQTALDRQARQMQFMKALVQKALTLAQGSPTRVVEMYNVMSDYATTNLTAAEVSYLATVFVGGSGSFETVSLQGESVFNDDSQWEQFILDKDSVYQTVLDVYYEKVD